MAIWPEKLLNLWVELSNVMSLPRQVKKQILVLMLGSQHACHLPQIAPISLFLQDGGEEDTYDALSDVRQVQVIAALDHLVQAKTPGQRAPLFDIERFGGTHVLDARAGSGSSPHVGWWGRGATWGYLSFTFLVTCYLADSADTALGYDGLATSSTQPLLFQYFLMENVTLTPRGLHTLIAAKLQIS